MRFSLLLSLVLILPFFSCKKEIQKQNTVNGAWESIGSGWTLQITDSTRYSFYDTTPICCLPGHSGPFTDIETSLFLKGDTLSLKKGVITYKFVRTEQLPIKCLSRIPEVTLKDPLYNFEVFAETIQEHYAFMELNGIHWDNLYQEQKTKLQKDPTNARLYVILEETLEKLNDNHAYLEADEEVYAAVEKWVDGGDKIQSDSLPEYGDFQIAEMVSKHHLQEEMTEDSWLIQWGTLSDGIGYIQVKAMWLFAALEIPEALIQEMGYVDAYVKTGQALYEGDFIEMERYGAKKIMDRVMDDLSDTEAMVVDIRFNGGGQDAVAFEILNRFIPKRTQVATQKLRYGTRFSPTLPLYVDGVKKPYMHPVYVLTSPQTGSAAEAFSIATMDVPHIKRIGAATSGAMSTALEKTLPNGWAFSLSNEIYMDNQGICYENRGIPVDYRLNYPTDRQAFFRAVADDLEKDKQNILRAVNELHTTP